MYKRLGAITHFGALEVNGPTEYTHNVRFTNIRPKINVTTPTETPECEQTCARGLMVDGIDVTVVKNCAAATVQGMKKRCDYSPQNDKEGVNFKRGHEFLMAKIHERDIIRIDESCVNEYIDTFATDKSVRLRDTWETQDFDLTDYNVKQVFAKTEVLVKDHGAPPRVIYQGTDLYNLLFGVVVYYLQKRMKEELSLANPLNTGNSVIYACGMRSEELGEIIDNSPGSAIENDMSANDATQASWMRKYEAMFYRKLGAPDWFVREFARNTSVSVWTRYGLAASIKGQRWSGEVTTTSGNSYVGGCQTLAFLDHLRIQKSNSVIYGDDELTFTEDPVPDGAVECVEKVIAESGMKGKPIVHVDRRNATFLRKRFVRDERGKHLAVPQFGRVLAKINVRGNFNTTVDDRAYMAGKYLSAAYEHRHVPHIPDRLLHTAQSMSKTPYMDQGNGAMSHGLTFDQMIVSILQARKIDFEEIDSFCHHVYGIPYDEVITQYDDFANSALEWCSDWTTVDKKGRVTTKVRNKPPAWRSNSSLRALTKVDC